MQLSLPQILKKSASWIIDFKPISLLNSIYKLIAPVLAHRLTDVMGNLIENTHGAFTKGRQIIDGILVTNEMVESRQKKDLFLKQTLRKLMTM